MSARMDLPGAFFVTHFLRAREACIDTAINFMGIERTVTWDFNPWISCFSRKDVYWHLMIIQNHNSSSSSSSVSSSSFPAS